MRGEEFDKYVHIINVYEDYKCKGCGKLIDTDASLFHQCFGCGKDIPKEDRRPRK